MRTTAPSLQEWPQPGRLTIRTTRPRAVRAQRRRCDMVWGMGVAWGAALCRRAATTGHRSRRALAHASAMRACRRARPRRHQTRRKTTWRQTAAAAGAPPLPPQVPGAEPARPAAARGGGGSGAAAAAAPGLACRRALLPRAQATGLHAAPLSTGLSSAGHRPRPSAPPAAACAMRLPRALLQGGARVRLGGGRAHRPHATARHSTRQERGGDYGGGQPAGVWRQPAAAGRPLSCGRPGVCGRHHIPGAHQPCRQPRDWHARPSGRHQQGQRCAPVGGCSPPPSRPQAACTLALCIGPRLRRP